MLEGLTKSLMIGAVQKGTGIEPPNGLTTTLITTGASLLLVKGRRPIGLALLAIGGLMLWRESERADQAEG